MSRIARTGSALVALGLTAALTTAPAFAADPTPTPARTPLTAGNPAAAAAPGVAITNTETVQAHLDATGAVVDKRVYEQIALQGKGHVDVENPVAPSGLRNLDGFSGFDVKDGVQRITADVDGDLRSRSVADFTKDLPAKVTMVYLLDGKEVEPGDLVGASGDVEVRYRVENTTGRKQKLTYDVGTGTASKDADVYVPLVGQLTTVLPPVFTDVTSTTATIAGDGHGGTKMSWTLTLFPPIGKPFAEFGYTAHLRDGELPPATLQLVPVSPPDNMSFKSGSASIQAGADSGVKLATGATTVDGKLVEIRDGASQLLTGIGKLRDGAKQLDTGLSGQAAPGSGKIAAGAKQLDGGMDQLADGLDQVDAGLTKLYTGVGSLPSNPGVLKLRDGIRQLRAGVGAKGTDGTLADGVDQLRTNIAEAKPGIQRMLDGIYTPGGGSYHDLGCALTVLRDVKQGTLLNGRAGRREPCYDGTQANGKVPPLLAADLVKGMVLDGVISGLQKGRAKLVDTGNLNPDPDTPLGGNPTLYEGLAYLRNRLDQRAVPGLVKVECGLDNTTLSACDRSKPGLAQGLALVDGGVQTLVSQVVQQVQSGVGQTDDGAADQTLRGGLNALQDGAAKLKDGTGQLSAGAARLTTGIDKAADGSGKIVGGLDTAASKGAALPTGAQQLHQQGTAKIAEAGRTTAANYGEQAAVLSAGAARAKVESMPYGAPKGATASAAYSLEIAGASDQGSQTTSRTLQAGGLFGVGALAAAWAGRRRRELV